MEDGALERSALSSACDVGGDACGRSCRRFGDHLWNQHIKPKTDARYYTKSRSMTDFFHGT